jgi:hypothetical protein
MHDRSNSLNPESACLQPSVFEQQLEHFTTSGVTMSSETKVRCVQLLSIGRAAAPTADRFCAALVPCHRLLPGL